MQRREETLARARAQLALEKLQRGIDPALEREVARAELRVEQAAAGQ
mgnify:CR=1 FL=1